MIFKVTRHSFLIFQQISIIILNGIIESTDKFISEEEARELKELLEMTKIERLYNEERDLDVKNARKEELLRIAKSLAGILSHK